MRRLSSTLRLTAAVGAGALALGLTQATAAQAATAPVPAPVTTLASGLQAPFGLDHTAGSVFVADNATGTIVRITESTRRKAVVASGFLRPTGVARIGSQLAVVTGGGDPPTFTRARGSSMLYLVRAGQRPRPFANLLAYELKHNPDGQLQFDPKTHKPLDSISNPFAVIAGRGRNLVLVADAGANAVLAVSRTGRVSTYFVPPVVTTGACHGQPNNDPAHAGCDPVPTGLAYGPHNTLYVSTLSSEVPGQGRVYVLNSRGRVVRVIRGLTAPTGVAVSPGGTVYTSQVLFGAPPGEGPPPAGFNPASVGRIVQITPYNGRRYASVTMPLGLDFDGGRLYASTWAIASQLGIKGAGKVVRIDPRVFRP